MVNIHVNALSTNHVFVTIANEFLFTQFTVVNIPQIKILPSGCKNTSLTALFGFDTNDESIAHVDIRRINWEFHQTKILPSGWILILFTLLDAHHVNVLSNAHVLVIRTIYALAIQLNVLKNHHTKILPSDWISISRIWLSAKDHVNVLSITHVFVNLTNLFLITQLNQVNAHQTNILPSGCKAKVRTRLLSVPYF